MNADLPNSADADAASLFSSGGHRKERGAIAAQACDTCRSRKQKCDEQRPKCGTCQKFKLECNYREPQPTKKDKTLIEILDRIKSLEGKLDNLSVRSSFSSASFSSPPPNLLPSSAGLIAAPGFIGSMGNNSSFHLQDSASSTSGGDDEYRYVSAVHQMLAWPAMQQALESVRPKTGIDPSTIEHDMPTIVLGMHDHVQPLPLDATGGQVQNQVLGMSMPPPGTLPLTLPDLTWDMMQQLSKAYFDTFNLMYPILDRGSFSSEIMPAVFNDGFDESMASTIVFLVFALGEVATAGTQGLPIHLYNGRPSGMKGGTPTQPPGLALFNEARKRMGFNLTECSLENVQVFALAGLFYGTCSHHMEFWRMTTSASLACQAVIASLAELSSPKGDLVKRAFWHCSTMETCLNLELGLPLTGLEKFEHVVGLPDFSGPFTQDDYIGNQTSHFQEHFASQIVLLRLLIDFHSVLSQSPRTSPEASAMAPAFSNFAYTSTSEPVNPATIKPLAAHLEQWRGMLPTALRWQEDSPGAFPTPAQEIYHSTMFPSTAPTTVSPTAIPMQSLNPNLAPGPAPPLHPPPPSTIPMRAPQMFSVDLSAPPTVYPYALDIQTALLRTRYYYAKHLVHRPFLYKALHYPDSMTHDDLGCVAACLRATLRWPILMSPVAMRKRLVPTLFLWTQNVLGVLIVLHVSSQSPLLARVRGSPHLCGEHFEGEARETVALCLDWLRDLQAVDTGAGWAWQLVKGLYGLKE